MIKYLDNFTETKLNDFRKLLKKQNRNNLFEYVCKMLEASKYKYGIKFTQNTGEIKNLNKLEDERLTKIGIKKTEGGFYWPPKGLDAYIEIDIELKMVDRATRSRSVNIVNIVFHELFEAYVMLDVGLQYKEAHNYIGIQEQFFMTQYPSLSEYWACGTLVKDKRPREIV
jgi:hypothetical protein